MRCGRCLLGRYFWTTCGGRVNRIRAVGPPGTLKSVVSNETTNLHRRISVNRVVVAVIEMIDAPDCASRDARTRCGVHFGRAVRRVVDWARVWRSVCGRRRIYADRRLCQSCESRRHSCAGGSIRQSMIDGRLARFLRGFCQRMIVLCGLGQLRGESLHTFRLAKGRVSQHVHPT